MSDYNLNRSGEFTNLGGILPFFFIPVEEITSISDIVLGIIEEINYDNPDFSPWFIDIVQESGSFTEDQKSKTRFEYSVSGLFAKDESAVRYILEYMNSKELIILVPDSNGKYRVIGSLENPVKHFSTKLRKGKKVSNLNAYELTFNWASKYRAAFINEDLPETYYIISGSEQLISYV